MTVIFFIFLCFFILNPSASILGMKVLARVVKRNWSEFLKQFTKAKVKVD